MNKRHIDPRRRLDALTNRGVYCLVLLLFTLLWILWSQFLIDYDVEPDEITLQASLLPTFSLMTPGFYESWPWTKTNFSEFEEYTRFIGNATHNTTFEAHQFSVETSDRIEVNRLVPDTRHLLCRVRNKMFNEQVRYIGKTSVIITFNNEAASVLLRTITSILRNTPSNLLGEIILIDDGSPIQLNATFLQHFHPKINFRRNAKREGVIASRNIGAMLMARHKYIFFLDSHCEVNVNWLEPLVERMMRNPGMVVSPTLDVIDNHSFEYESGTYDGLRAGFDWSLKPLWFNISGEELADRGHGWNETRSYSSPIAAGGLFGMTRQWFVELGGFHRTLQTWGGESLELSMRVWMCGGHVEIVPCSRVGHVFRSKLPYDLPLGQAATQLLNSRTIAELWFSDYKRLFYEHSLDVAQPSNRLETAKIQNCRTFRWYLENVYQELIPWSNIYQSIGQLQQAGRCVEHPITTVPTDPQLSSCHRTSTEWLFLKNGQIVLGNRPAFCLWPVGRVIKTDSTCETLREGHIWLRRENELVHRETGDCLDVMDETSQRLVLNNCNVRERRTQIWHFTVKL